MIANVIKDFIPLGKIHLKKEACQIQIDALFEKDMLLDIKPMLTKKELDGIEKLKEHYCESH
nr:hypothetical protein [uncultured Psychroserpens sp.]